MKPIRCLLALSLLAFVAFGSGCASSKPLARIYFEPGHDMGVAIAKIPDKPRMRDSGAGGIIGAMVNAGRGSKMKERMAGIQGETVKELLRQELTSRVQESFAVVEKPNDLSLEVNVLTYGWFCRSTIAGIRTGAYQFEVMAQLFVYDLKDKKKKVAFGPMTIQKPIGNDPGEAAVQEALLLTAKEFAERSVALLFSEKNAPLPPEKGKKKAVAANR